MGAIFDPNFWNGLDKEGLKNQKFVIRSDEDLPSHVVSIPQGVTIANIVFRYSDRPEKTRCIKCGMKRHKNGAVIALSSGDLALIGSKCGPDYFGVDEWRRAESAFLQAKKRSESLRWADEFIQNYKNIFDSLISIREFLRSFEMKSKVISDFFGVQSYQRIRDICVKNAGELAYDQKIESVEKIEAIRMSKRRPDDDGNYLGIIPLTQV